MQKIYARLFKNTTTVVLTVLFSVALIVSGAYAASTIGNNTSIGGTLTVTGASTLTGAVTTGAALTVGSVASTTDYLVIGNSLGNDDDAIYFDIGLAESFMWDDDPGQFALTDDLNVTGVSTSTLAVWAGSGGTANNINLTGGDLYVQNDAEIDGSLYVTTDLAVTGNATTTGDLVISGGDLNKDGTALTVYGALTASAGLISGSNIVSDTDSTDNLGSSSVYWANAYTDVLYLNATASFSGATAGVAALTGALTVSGSATTTGDLVISGGDLNSNGTGLTLGGKATSTGDFVVGNESATATTTLSIKTAGGDGSPASCIEMVDVNGTITRIYLNGTTMKIEAGTCK